MSDIYLQIQEPLQSPGRVHVNHTWEQHSKTPENQNQKEYLNAVREKDTLPQMSNKTVSRLLNFDNGRQETIAYLQSA